MVTIAADIEADPDARYYLKPVRNYFYDDDIKLTVNAKHLLSTGNATAEDQTARIISTAASIAATAVHGPAPAPPPPLAPSQLPEYTVDQMLWKIQGAIDDNVISLDSKIQVPSTALANLRMALPNLDVIPAFPTEKKEDIGVTLRFLQLSHRNWFTPREMRDLLRLFAPEASERKIQAIMTQSFLRCYLAR